jgi:hypothetical protein
LLWKGSAGSVIDLHPAGYNNSRVYDAAWTGSGGVQVGSGSTGGPQRALLWRGSSESAVEMHLESYGSSIIRGTNGFQHAGSAAAHAAVWTGSDPQVFDLHTLLPPGQYQQSFATGIDEFGNVYGIAYFVPGIGEPIVWVRVPEPAALPLFALTALLARRRRAVNG